MSAICVRLGSKGKVGVQRGRETAGVPSFLPPPRARRRSRRPQTANPPAEVQRKTFRPSGANTLTQFAHPAQPVQKRSRPSGANPLTQFAHPGQPVQKRSRPLGANPLTQFAHPAGSVQKKSRPLGVNMLTQFEHPAQPVQKKGDARTGCSAYAPRVHRKAGAAKKSAAHGHLSTRENQIFLRFTL